MQNLFMPSETIACIEQKYVGRTYKIQGKAFTEPFTKEKIRALFDVYIEALNQVFGGRALVMQRTRAIKGGTIVPATSFEYVYKNKQSISSYVDEGYYAVTINGYRVSDIIDSGLYKFYESISSAKKVIESISNTLDTDTDETKAVLEKFFFNSGMQNFDAFLTAVMNTGKMDVYKFDVCASNLCSFGEPLPVIGSCTDIQIMSREAQDQGFAVDEVDLDGWKDEKNRDPVKRRTDFLDFYNSVVKFNFGEMEKLPDCEPDMCEKCEAKCTCDQCYNDEEEGEEDGDDLDEIREDIDNENTKNHPENQDLAKKEPEPVKDEERKCKDEHVDIATASDGNNYTYSITWTDKDGKPQSKTFYGEAAKKMMSKGDCMDEKLKDKCDNEPTLKDAFNFFDKRLAKLEGDMRNLQRPERPVRVRLDRDPFDLFGGWRDLFGGF